MPLESAAKLQKIADDNAAYRKKVNHIIDKIGEYILAAAKRGEYEHKMFAGSVECSSKIHDPDVIGVGKTSDYFNITDKEFSAIKEILKENGYKTRLEKDKTTEYVPAGLMDSDGYGPLYCNAYLIVSWSK